MLILVSLKRLYKIEYMNTSDYVQILSKGGWYKTHLHWWKESPPGMKQASPHPPTNDQETSTSHYNPEWDNYTPEKTQYKQ